jgi:hypothetical protein
MKVANETTFDDVMCSLGYLSKGIDNYRLIKSRDIMEFAPIYFKYADYDYFDVLGSLKNPYQMTIDFKRFSGIDLSKEPNETAELNQLFIDYVCSRRVLAKDLFIETTVNAMMYFVDDEIDKVSQYFGSSSNEEIYNVNV